MRGDIYYLDLGKNGDFIQSGVRPVIVLQCNNLNDVSETAVVAPITTAAKKYLSTHVYLKNDGVKENSMILLEQIKTVRTSDFQRFVCYVNDPRIMKIINRGIRNLLMSEQNPQDRNATSVHLCKECLNEMLNNGDYIVRRINHYDTAKDICDICKEKNGYGYKLVKKDQR